MAYSSLYPTKPRAPSSMQPSLILFSWKHTSFHLLFHSWTTQETAHQSMVTQYCPWPLAYCVPWINQSPSRSGSALAVCHIPRCAGPVMGTWGVVDCWLPMRGESGHNPRETAVVLFVFFRWKEVEILFCLYVTRNPIYIRISVCVLTARWACLCMSVCVSVYMCMWLCNCVCLCTVFTCVNVPVCLCI